ncbi:hypothetical protein EJB05_46860, partial [Eragrostis curvula]
MGTGWRRALCTSVQRDDHDDDANAKAKKRRPQDRAGGFFFKSGSNPATPTLRCRTKPLQEPADSAPVTPPSAPAPMRKPRMLLLQALSAPASPRSPSRFALLKASLLPSKCRCGVCCRSVKSSGSSAVFTAECSHTFHFPCIAGHARSSAGVLCCPVCASPWCQAPFLASLRLHYSFHDDARKTASKLYDDDEPLVAPKAAANGGGFNPIPEEEEFGGFFPGGPNRGRRSSTGLAVSVAPEAALVSSGRWHGKYVVAVKVKAPGLSSSKQQRRAAIDLVTVLDVSQGMMGEKLQTLKRGMRLVIASLGPTDRLSIVAFSGATKRLLPLRRMTRQGQRSARQIVDRLVVCASAAAAASSAPQGQEEQHQGGGCVGDALRKATKVLEDRHDRNPVATVMLLSDTTQQQPQQCGSQQIEKLPTEIIEVDKCEYHIVDGLREHVKKCGLAKNVELVITSPLLRTMQTAVGVFGGDNYTDGVSAPPLMVENAGHSGRPAVSSLNCPPFLAVETCREHLIENDVLWEPDVREANEAVKFIDWLWTREEKEIAVVSHSGFLYHTLSMYSKECHPTIQQEVSKHFANCELQSMVLVDRSMLGSDSPSFNYPGKVPPGLEIPSDVADKKLLEEGPKN